MQSTTRPIIAGGILGRILPEKRLFLRFEAATGTETRFLRLSPATQLAATAGAALVVGWAIVASSILIMDSIGSGNLRDQAAREQALYEERLNALSDERDTAVQQARDAHERFNVALASVSDMQSDLLEAQGRQDELARGLDVSRTALRTALKARDAARTELAAIAAEKTDGAETDTTRLAAAEATLDTLVATLGHTAAQRDSMAAEVADAEVYAEEMLLRARAVDDRNDRIFTQLEDALTISVSPLDKMFKKAGLSTDSLLETVRRGNSGQGGPLTPISFSSRGEPGVPDGSRANSILEKLDRMNLYRIAAEKAPFDVPIKSAFRYTSGYGPRWGRMHEGTDFAGPHGTPIYATADGVVAFAGRQSGYGKLVKIRHAFGIETRYAHQSRIRVEVGQRVSRGDRIGDMGNTGRSTGTHLHYEVRVNGEAVNSMTYIKAGQDVF